jgi:hypothetical protein
MLQIRKTIFSVKPRAQIFQNRPSFPEFTPYNKKKLKNLPCSILIVNQNRKKKKTFFLYIVWIHAIYESPIFLHLRCNAIMSK